MAYLLKQYEADEQRQGARTPEGDRTYQRLFELPLAAVSGLLPTRGAELPDKLGLDPTYDSLLGPYVRDFHYGQKLQAEDGSWSQIQLIVEGRLLVARSGATLSGGYIELGGRVPGEQSVEAILYKTRGVCTNRTDAGAPKAGDVLSNPDVPNGLPAVCQGVIIDEVSEPGRVIVLASWYATRPRQGVYV